MRSLTPAFSISAYCVSNWLSASICLLRSSAAGCAPSPATTRLMSVSGFRPDVAASARAMITPADAMLVTPIVLPLRSESFWIGLSAGTAIA